MEKKPLQSNVFSDSVMENLQILTDMSMEFYGTMLENITGNNVQFQDTTAQLGKNVLNPLRAMFNSGDCCPPRQECPPHCIASISRTALPGERIIIPFQVINDCSKAKVYRVGVRELIDQDGNKANSQPQLSKNKVSLQPHASERVLVVIDTTGMDTGTYTLEIVLREREYNQNICLTLTLEDQLGTKVTPRDEKKYKLKWQSWKSHYYCEPNQSRQNDFASQNPSIHGKKSKNS